MAVYFFLDEDSGLIKIGVSQHLSRRLLQVSADGGDSDPRELVVLGVMDGGPDEEGELHRRFARLNVRRGRGRSREWFRDDPELRRYIREHAEPWCPPDEPDDDALAMRPTKVEIRAHALHDARAAARLKGVPFLDWVTAAVVAATERDLGEL